MNNTLFRLAPAVALCLPLLALAQAGQPDPADSKASVPALRYQSAFADYKPWTDTRPGDWRAVNDNVRDAAAKGGAHAAPGAPAAAPAASAPASQASAPAMPGHGGHHQHGGKQ
jgi:hypothetical protein